ncbi:MAG: CCA tRNA nucleotidyltransferase [Chitinivibrionia bacterium]|nr:CCA tRNA nucleotidyltransferase [Chitinivibrionia bacterium]
MLLHNAESIAKSIVVKLVNSGHEAYYAGGFVRDMILNFPAGNSPDIDVATSARPEEIVKLFKNTKEVGVAFGVVLVIEKGNAFDVATFRSDGQYIDGRRPENVKFVSAKEDALRRDFTINGMFYNPVSKTIIDFVDGQNDLQKKIIRTIGQPQERFCEDYLRMLRAIRFSSRFNFEIEEKTLLAIKNLSKNITKVSAERICKELTLSFCDAPARTLKILDETGLLPEILPEISSLRGVEQPPEFHPEGDCFTHTLLAMEYLEDLIEKFIENPKTLREDQINVLSDNHKRSVLVWSVLLHDIGKPSTMTFEDRIRFNRHDEKSEEMTYEIAKRLKMSSSQTKDICACVRNHMKFMFVQKMRVSKLKTFMGRETIDVEIILHEADCFASHGMMDNAEFLLRKLAETPPQEIKPVPIVRGDDLIALGFVQGKKLGDVLREIYENQLDGIFNNKEEAIEFAKKQLLQECEVNCV